MLFAAILIAVAALAQDEMSYQAKNARTSMQQFLQEEGYSPFIDEDDGSLCFKKEGVLYYIYFSGTTTLMAEFHRGGINYENGNMSDLQSAANDVNLTKYIKCYVTKKKIVGFSMETYFNSIEEYKYTFYQNIDALDAGRDYFIKIYEDDNTISGNNPPFSISSVFIGNVTSSYTTITDYGKPIYSSTTQYLRPKLYVDINTEGNYDIYVKLYSPNGLSTGDSSPSGYSYSNTLKLTKSNREYYMSGWGSSTSGHWKSGSYRMEFYYNNKLIYTKNFNVL